MVSSEASSVFIVKDFFELSSMLVTFYLLSALPTLFFVLKIRSTPMRAVVYIVLFFVMIMSLLQEIFPTQESNPHILH